MPNHCSNKLGITGPIEDVEKFIAFVKNNGDDKDENEYNLFESLIPMPKELEGTTSPSKESNVDLIDKYGHDNWYDWCNSKWGTKWGDYSMHATSIVYETKINYPHLEDGDVDFENGVSVLTGNANIHFEYDTAWAPGCDELAEAIVKQFPTLNGYIHYEEPGMCFAGQLIFAHGEIKQHDQWEHHYVPNEVTDIDFDLYAN
jgi:hypothetical protein